MMNMMNGVKKAASAFWRGLSLTFALCFLVAEGALALPEAGHVAVQNQYIWGMTTESGRTIHSRIIDKVPWRDNVGGWDHRKLWGHSEEWFYKGRIPKAEAMENIKANLLKQNPSLSGRQLEAAAQKVFKEAVSKTGQERIAEALRKYAPSLTKNESMAMAEQLYASHLIGDSTTAEGMRDMSEALKQRMREIVSSPSPDAIRAYNKLAMTEAMRKQGEKFSATAFSRQQQNFIRLKVEQCAQSGFKIYNPTNRDYIGITVKGQNYILRMNGKDVKNVLDKVPGAKVTLPDDEYAKFFKNGKNADLAERVLPMSKVTGETATLAEQQEEITRLAVVEQAEVLAGGESRLASLSKALKKTVPYAIGGTFMSLSENWGILQDAWDGKTTWARALPRIGVDFAGYTVTPYVVDGLLTQAGGKSVIAASLKNAGMGYTLGFFIWNAGKEYLAYRIGDISQKDFVNRMKQRGEQAGREAAMIPINMLVCKLVGSAGTFFVPIVIIGGSFAIQRVQQWYVDKQWRETIYLEDVKEMLGEDLINEFTLMNPEMRPSLADPGHRSNLSAPEERPSLTNPEKRQSIIGY